MGLELALGLGLGLDGWFWEFGEGRGRRDVGFISLRVFKGSGVRWV